MKKTETVQIKYIKLSNALLAAFICLVLGFVGGNIYSVYKGGEQAAGRSSAGFSNPSADRSNDQKDQQIKALEEAVKQDPDNIIAWLDLGNLYFDSDHFEGAIRAYEKYLKRDPNNPNVLTDLGVMYRRSGQAALALDSFNKAILASPAHQQSRFNKGIVLLHDMNDPPAALKAWKELQNINPNFHSPSGQSLQDLISSVK